MQRVDSDGIGNSSLSIQRKYQAHHDSVACWQVLVLDDEPLILLDLECAVADAGCVPLTAIAPDEALAILEAQDICAAILDVSLGQGLTCEPVARALAARGVPYVLHTGDPGRMDDAVRRLGGVLVSKPTPAATVVSRALESIACPVQRFA